MIMGNASSSDNKERDNTNDLDSASASPSLASPITAKVGVCWACKGRFDLTELKRVVAEAAMEARVEVEWHEGANEVEIVLYALMVRPRFGPVEVLNDLADAGAELDCSVPARGTEVLPLGAKDGQIKTDGEKRQLVLAIASDQQGQWPRVLGGIPVLPVLKNDHGQLQSETVKQLQGSPVVEWLKAKTEKEKTN